MPAVQANLTTYSRGGLGRLFYKLQFHANNSPALWLRWRQQGAYCCLQDEWNKWTKQCNRDNRPQLSVAEVQAVYARLKQANT